MKKTMSHVLVCDKRYGVGRANDSSPARRAGHEADSYQHVMDVSRDAAADNSDLVVTGLDIPGTKWTF